MMGVLVAGIGNIFMGDDGFGVEVSHRLARQPLPEGVRVVDFGIRGLDLAYALLEPHDAVVLIDVVSRGGVPGTLYLMEPPVADAATTLEAHGMDPVKVLRLARSLGAPAVPTYLVACEAARVPEDELGEMEMGLSPAVEAAVPGAVEMVEQLVERLAAGARETDELVTPVPAL